VSAWAQTYGLVLQQRLHCAQHVQLVNGPHSGLHTCVGAGSVYAARVRVATARAITPFQQITQLRRRDRRQPASVHLCVAPSQFDAVHSVKQRVELGGGQSYILVGIDDPEALLEERQALVFAWTKKHLGNILPLSRLKSSGAPIRPRALWRFYVVGSSREPLLGCTRCRKLAKKREKRRALALLPLGFNPPMLRKLCNHAEFCDQTATLATQFFG
jgi:hypothetical protein